MIPLLLLLALTLVGCTGPRLTLLSLTEPTWAECPLKLSTGKTYVVNAVQPLTLTTCSSYGWLEGSAGDRKIWVNLATVTTLQEAPERQRVEER
jgi:hypothetical protein